MTDKIRLKDISTNEEVQAYLQAGNEALAVQGYTEHSFQHATRVANTAAYILKELGYSEREIELVKIAAFLHDIGNVVNRVHHAQSGALIALDILSKMGMEPSEKAIVVSAIGHHDEEAAAPLNPVSAALILADKADVRRSRVQNTDKMNFDIHDRVNYAVSESQVKIELGQQKVILKITIDTEISSVIEYFEIFLVRMILSRRAAQFFGYKFELVINDVIL